MVCQQKLLPVTTFGEWPEQIYECVKEQSQILIPIPENLFNLFFFCKSAIYSLLFTITLSKRKNTTPYAAPPRLNLKRIRPCTINLGILK